MPGGYARLPFADPEGQRLALVASEAVATGHDGAAGDGVPASVRGGAEEPWHAAGIPQENAVHGLADVTLTSLEPSETLALLTEVLGFRWISPDGEAAGNLLECGPGGLGAQVRVMGPGAEGVGRPGVGGVHHVAFRTPDAEQQEAWRERILHAGVPVTKVIDRFYFRSIYFREPGGGLFEIATDGPGFTQDEDVSTLGERLSLPPFLEPRRQEIEAALRPLEASV
jgi:glyoxalase family protein